MKQQPRYTISNFTLDNESINAEINFDEKHNIFKGHFPGNPIVPGVVQVQIIKDLAEKGLQKELLLTKSKNIKFLNFISPVENKSVGISVTYQILEDNSIKVNASIFSNEITFLKFIGLFEEKKTISQ